VSRLKRCQNALALPPGHSGSFPAQTPKMAKKPRFRPSQSEISRFRKSGTEFGRRYPANAAKLQSETSLNLSLHPH
jgi:hypothetical protein